MQASTLILSKDQVKEQRIIQKEQKDQQQIASRMRKERMIQMDKARANKLPKTEQDIQDGLKNEHFLSRAQHLLDENEDDVKAMNKMMLYSKVVTIRDKQLEENKRLEKDWAEEQKRLDLLMEIERLKDLKEQEGREQRRQAAANQGAKKIIEQIAVRDEERQRQLALLEQERLVLLNNIEIQKQNDKKAAAVKAERARLLMFEVEASNKQAIQIKQQRKEQEQREEMGVIEYNKKKLAAEEAAIREAA